MQLKAIGFINFIKIKLYELIFMITDKNLSDMFEVNLRKSIAIPLYMENTYRCEASSAQSTIQYSDMTKGLFSKQ
jgi:hypothetical protein